MNRRGFEYLMRELWEINSSISAALMDSLLLYLCMYSSSHATRTQAPPASLILFSASLENNLALTIRGTLGTFPFPSTLKNPCEINEYNINYGFSNIDHSGLVLACLSLFSCLFWHQWPQLVKIDSWLEVMVSLETEDSHTELSKVPRVTAHENH